MDSDYKAPTPEEFARRSGLCGLYGLVYVEDKPSGSTLILPAETAQQPSSWVAMARPDNGPKMWYIEATGTPGGIPKGRCVTFDEAFHRVVEDYCGRRASR